MGKIYDEVDRNVDCGVFSCKERELEGTLQFSRFPHYALKTARVVYERS